MRTDTSTFRARAADTSTSVTSVTGNRSPRNAVVCSTIGESSVRLMSAFKRHKAVSPLRGSSTSFCSATSNRSTSAGFTLFTTRAADRSMCVSPDGSTTLSVFVG